MAVHPQPGRAVSVASVVASTPPSGVGASVEVDALTICVESGQFW